MPAVLIRLMLASSLVLAPVLWPGLDAPPAAWADDHGRGGRGDDDDRGRGGRGRDNEDNRGRGGGGRDDGDRGSGGGGGREGGSGRGGSGGDRSGGEHGGDRSGGSGGFGGFGDDRGRRDDNNGRGKGGGRDGGSSRGDPGGDRRGGDHDSGHGGRSSDDGGHGRGRGIGNNAEDDSDDVESLSAIPEARPTPRGVQAPTLGQSLRGLFNAGLSEGRDVVEREFLGVDLTEADLAALAARGYVEISSRPLGGLGITLRRFRAPLGLGLREALAAARQTAPGATFDYNHFYSGTGAGCDGPTCWGAALTNISALPPDACLRGAPLAVVDTAVDTSHPALRGARIESRTFLPPGATSAPPDHGTAVAALLVGRLKSDAAPLAPGATLLAAEAISMRDDEQRADAAAVIAAIDWALDRGARVISLSLAGAPNLLLGRAVSIAAAEANLVAAAGNAGPGADPAYPAAYPEVTAVAAVDQRKRPWSGGNRGDYLELAAPGVDVVSAAPGGGLGRWTGTSFATPFAAAALLRARAIGGGDPQTARRLLADAAEDLGAPGRDPLSGHGLVRSPGLSCW